MSQLKVMGFLIMKYQLDFRPKRHDGFFSEESKFEMNIHYREKANRRVSKMHTRKALIQKKDTENTGHQGLMNPILRIFIEKRARHSVQKKKGGGREAYALFNISGPWFGQ